jgi:hypothetical protein
MLWGIFCFIVKIVTWPIRETLIEELSFGAFSGIVNGGELLW